MRRCGECSGRRLRFAKARSALVYDERARAFVREWKERGRRTLAAKAAELVLEVVPTPDVEAVTFVPGDPERALERGHVAPRSLGAELASAWELPFADILRRERSLPRQRGLTLAERRRNVLDSVSSGTAPPSVVVVDDVYTSGATADACAAALRRAGGRRVEVVTLARAVR